MVGQELCFPRLDLATRYRRRAQTSFLQRVVCEMGKCSLYAPTMRKPSVWNTNIVFEVSPYPYNAMILFRSYASPLTEAPRPWPTVCALQSYD